MPSLSEDPVHLLAAPMILPSYLRSCGPQRSAQLHQAPILSLLPASGLLFLPRNLYPYRCILSSKPAVPPLCSPSGSCHLGPLPSTWSHRHLSSQEAFLILSSTSPVQMSAWPSPTGWQGCSLNRDRRGPALVVQAFSSARGSGSLGFPIWQMGQHIVGSL